VTGRPCSTHTWPPPGGQPDVGRGNQRTCWPKFPPPPRPRSRRPAGSSLTTLTSTWVGRRREGSPPRRGVRRPLPAPDLAARGALPARPLPVPTMHLRFPAEHRRRIRHTNLLWVGGAHLQQTRQPTKIIGRLPGKRSCLRLVWAVLCRASRGWRGRPTPGRHPAVPRPRRQLLYPCSSPEVIDPPVTPAAEHAHPEHARSTISGDATGPTRRSRSCFAEASRATAPRDRLQPVSASPKPPGGAGARLAVYAPPDQQRPLS
jgi:hypothetical protein